MERTTRRILLGGAAAAGLGVMASHRVVAGQVATPAVSEANAPGYAIVRMRTQASAELNQAFYPDVMAKLVPPTTATPGVLGYAFAFDDADPASALSLTTLTDADAATAAAEVASGYVGELDPRFSTETSLSVDGRVRMYATTDRAPEELPPFLHGTTFTVRNQTNAPGLDLEETIRIATESLIPLFRSLPGFILYCWFEQPGGRVAVNVWDTPADLAAASDALAAWRAEYFTAPTSTGEVAYSGTIGYAAIADLT